MDIRTAFTNSNSWLIILLLLFILLLPVIKGFIKVSIKAFWLLLLKIYYGLKNFIIELYSYIFNIKSNINDITENRITLNDNSNNLNHSIKDRNQRKAAAIPNNTLVSKKQISS